MMMDSWNPKRSAPPRLSFFGTYLAFSTLILTVPTVAYSKKAPDATHAIEVDAAKAEADKADKNEEKWSGRKRDHAKQGFVNMMLGTGYFLVAPYGDNKDSMDMRCKTNTEEPWLGEPICSGRSGWHLDFLAGYGLRPGLELFLIFRLGLERPDNDGLMNQPLVRQLGIGVKKYTPAAGFFKIGFGAAALIDFSNRGAAGIRNDLVIQVPIQAQFDIFPWFGPYAQIAPNISFISEFRLEFTGGIGVQGRFP